MHIAILGAGVVGLTTAAALIERGHRVTIVDRQVDGGLETSFANGAQLSYAYVAPFASVSTLKKLPSLLLGSDSPTRLGLRLDVDFLRWGLAFLRACNAGTEHETTLAQLALAGLSRVELQQLTARLGLEYGLNEPGKLVVFRSSQSLASAAKASAKLQASGIAQDVVDAAHCLELEPALDRIRADIKGGIFTPSEQVGDCAAFCQGLAQHLKNRSDVTWRMAETILSPVIAQGRLNAVRTSAGLIEADAFVLCMATNSVGFARSAGFYLPIEPMKGYSLTIPVMSGKGQLGRSVTDFDRKIVFAPLRHGNTPMLRAAGIADLVGNTTTIDQRRLDVVWRAAQATFALDKPVDPKPWTGLRPATPTSRPIIGQSPVDGLFLNTGQGALGWTLACGSARLCADLIDREPPSISPEPFALSSH